MFLCSTLLLSLDPHLIRFASSRFCEMSGVRIFVPARRFVFITGNLISATVPTHRIYISSCVACRLSHCTVPRCHVIPFYEDTGQKGGLCFHAISIGHSFHFLCNILLWKQLKFPSSLLCSFFSLLLFFIYFFLFILLVLLLFLTYLRICARVSTVH
jgi:hypothetical protein